MSENCNNIPKKGLDYCKNHKPKPKKCQFKGCGNNTKIHLRYYDIHSPNKSKVIARYNRFNPPQNGRNQTGEGSSLRPLSPIETFETKNKIRTKISDEFAFFDDRE